jgi:hypothetical protein
VTEQFELKRISPAAAAEAVKKAEHYRLLNDSEQAESICLDVLEVDPENQRALVTLVLAITDQFGSDHRPLSGSPAHEYVALLTDEYQRLYYAGIVHERQGRAQIRRGLGSVFAYGALRDAMECYAKAARIGPEGNDEAILRWNACVRTIRKANLEPRPVEIELPLE